MDAEYDFGVQGAHSNTFGGNGIALAAAKATLEVMEEEHLVERAAEMGTYFIEKLHGVAAPATIPSATCAGKA